MSPDARVADLVRVRDAWNGWHTVEVPRSELHDVCWLRPAGAPQAILHARVRCSQPVTDGIPHTCGTPEIAHDVGVCVLRVDVTTSTYERLVAEATRPRAR